MLESLGHVVEEVVFPGLDEQLTDAFMIILTTSLAWEIDAWSRKIGKAPTKDDFEPATWALFEIGKQNTATHYVDAISNVHQFSRNFANNFIGYDILVTPTLAEPPLVLGSLDPTNDDPLAGFTRSATYIPFTPICNMTGQPAMSVPLFWNSDNLPIGVHFMGRYADEATLFRLAAQLEAAKPWMEKRPQI